MIGFYDYTVWLTYLSFISACTGIYLTLAYSLPMYGIVWTQAIADGINVILSFIVYRRFERKTGLLDKLREAEGNTEGQ